MIIKSENSSSSISNLWIAYLEVSGWQFEVRFHKNKYDQISKMLIEKGFKRERFKEINSSYECESQYEMIKLLNILRQEGYITKDEFSENEIDEVIRKIDLERFIPSRNTFTKKNDTSTYTPTYFKTEKKTKAKSLHDAINKTDFDMSSIIQQAKTFLLAGADVNEKSNCKIDSSKDISKGITPLHIACYHQSTGINSKSVELIKLLLEHGADINCQDDDGNTPLHYATHHQGDRNISHWGTHPTHNSDMRNNMRFLLSSGADPTIQNKKRIDCRNAVVPLIRSDWFLGWRKAYDEHQTAVYMDQDGDYCELRDRHIKRLIDSLTKLYKDNNIEMLKLTIADAKGTELGGYTNFFNEALEKYPPLTQMLKGLSNSIVPTQKVFDISKDNPYLSLDYKVEKKLIIARNTIKSEQPEEKKSKIEFCGISAHIDTFGIKFLEPQAEDVKQDNNSLAISGLDISVYEFNARFEGKYKIVESDKFFLKGFWQVIDKNNNECGMFMIERNELKETQYSKGKFDLVGTIKQLQGYSL